MECDIFPSVLWYCWLGDRKGIRPVKKLDVGLLVVMIWLEHCTTYSSSPVVTTTSIILCFNKHRLIQVHLEMAVKRRERAVAPLCWTNSNSSEVSIVNSCKMMCIMQQSTCEDVSWVVGWRPDGRCRVIWYTGLPKHPSTYQSRHCGSGWRCNDRWCQSSMF